MNRLPPIHLGAPGEEIGKKDLLAITQRFKYFNFCRLQRLQEFLQPKQYEFLQLLPLLLHINHPLLPGFVSSSTPQGISGYHPDKLTLSIARQFSRSFDYKPQLSKKPQLYSVFLMGSVGSMAFSKHSDIDIWLCHQPDLNAVELDLLTGKLQELEKWAASLKIEAHFFLINNEKFKRGENAPISADSSGYTQHFLLLEEFYRTAIYIAGRIPVWWLVPPSQELKYAEYVQHLLANRFVTDYDLIDLGGLQHMPLTEFVSATLWQIFKSLNSPHKSLLKLFLMESYASEFPQQQWLCVSLKQAIYLGEFSVDSLDPYWLIYSKVQSYLQARQAPERLQLARECFHLKIMGASDAELDPKTRLLRNDYLHNVAAQWDWPAGLLDKMGRQRFWTIEKACVQHSIIREELQQCLRMMLKLVGNPVDHNYLEHHDLKVISRKLRVALDALPEKVEVLTTRSMVQDSVPMLLLVEKPQLSGESVWHLYRESRSSAAGNSQSIKQAGSLIELLCWLVVNGLYHKHINLKLVSATLQLSQNDLNALVSEINAFLSTHLSGAADSLEVYTQPSHCVATLLAVNLTVQPHFDANGQLHISKRFDAFSYGEERLSLLETVTKIAVSSWGEVSLYSASGLAACLESMLAIFNTTPQPITTDQLVVLCYTPALAKSICERIRQLFAVFQTCFVQSGKLLRNRYFMAAENVYYVFQYVENLLNYTCLHNQAELLKELGRAQTEFSLPVFDAWVLEQTCIPALYKQIQPGSLQLFYAVGSESVSVYIIDEKAALFIAQHTKAHPQQVLKQYALFLGTLALQAKMPAIAEIKCFEIQKQANRTLNLQAVNFKLDQSALTMRVGIRYSATTNSYVLYCNEDTFAFEDAQSFKAVKQQIFSFRQSRDDFPIYLTDIDVPPRVLGVDAAEKLQTVHYLRYKQKLEERLNMHGEL
ncbi:class I adenylate cyclase [Methylomonas sp. AM2-LC]|uniref:class I adenylate cyclase n=1 Tax=Methylomonas sp. AM2-LC TaxID=3153301 RepID=UPI0032651202